LYHAIPATAISRAKRAGKPLSRLHGRGRAVDFRAGYNDNDSFSLVMLKQRMLERSNAHRRIDLAARVLSAVAIPVVVCLSFGRTFFAGAAQQSARDSWWQAAAKGPAVFYERDKDTRIIRELCNRENIPFIEILPAIGNHPGIESPYYSPDGHFAPAGVALVAGVIADHLCAHYFGDCKAK
jgi:hypothetical protein